MHKQTAATSIPRSVKIAVWHRDGCRCVICGAPVDWGCASAHIVRRSQGGLGVERNIFTACPDCHRAHDEGPEAKGLQQYIIRYITELFPGWTRESVTYHKGG